MEPGAGVNQQFIMAPAKEPRSRPVKSDPNSIMNIPAEAYNASLAIIDPEKIYLNTLTRLLYSAHLVRSDIIDELSPVPGYKLTLIGGGERTTLVNWGAYNTITNNYMLLVSQTISTTEFDTTEINLRKTCVDGVWAIIVQLVSNWEDWGFRDPMQIMPLGIGMWFNLYAVSRRSTGGGKMLRFLTGVFKFLGHGKNNDDEDAKGKVKLFGRRDRE